jgi:hypothetical protein
VPHNQPAQPAKSVPSNLELPLDGGLAPRMRLIGPDYVFAFVPKRRKAKSVAGGARDDSKVRYFISLHREALIRLRWQADSISLHVDESPVTIGIPPSCKTP